MMSWCSFCVFLIFLQLYWLYFQICVSSQMCLETVYSILGYWNDPLTNILGSTGCQIANFLRVTGGLETQLHSFIMATTRYVFLFHDNLLLRFNLTTHVSPIICLHLNFIIMSKCNQRSGLLWKIFGDNFSLN